MTNSGGLIKDSLELFARNSGINSSVSVELWVLGDGLELVVALGLTHVIIELDALIVVSILNSSTNVHPCLLPLVDDCRSLLRRIP